ncbi:conserved protein of unknown function [Pseudorhizobium banfieldiae]|uniref:Phage tail assembly chaperone protein, E, or 41 or 14 n=1 Tax=Pseudorhizobium banfieldiae TaxID=1125847 RepID=L0NDQ1_9HYPH|nr:phage tail assembly protein [Pseudorhizobium banfieldiae]CAD6606280.1 phage tail assembly protein [arsenite-oxidising bacterium NT-25]CCF19175.1 conserved protein of unknown function [Pseudorhizobium banfieldiae]
MNTVVGRTKALSAEELARVEARQTQQAEAEASAPAAPKFASKQERTREVPLEWPLEYDGKTWDKITVRRAVGPDFKAIAQLGGTKDEDVGLARILSDAPEAIIRALDGDDYATLMEAIRDFLPRKLRAGDEPTSENGTSTQQSSPTSSTSDTATS